MRIGMVERSVEEATRLGFANSNHTRRLAGDLHLFRDGVYLTHASSHDELGVFWKAQHPLCRHGGDFQSGDANHYSLLYQGVM